LCDLLSLTVWQSLAVVVLVSAADQPASPAGFWAHCNLITYLELYMPIAIIFIHCQADNSCRRCAEIMCFVTQCFCNRFLYATLDVWLTAIHCWVTVKELIVVWRPRTSPVKAI